MHCAFVQCLVLFWATLRVLTSSEWHYIRDAVAHVEHTMSNSSLASFGFFISAMTLVLWNKCAGVELYFAFLGIKVNTNMVKQGLKLSEKSKYANVCYPNTDGRKVWNAVFKPYGILTKWAAENLTGMHIVYHSLHKWKQLLFSICKVSMEVHTKYSIDVCLTNTTGDCLPTIIPTFNMQSLCSDCLAWWKMKGSRS